MTEPRDSDFDAFDHAASAHHEGLRSVGRGAVLRRPGGALVMSWVCVSERQAGLEPDYDRFEISAETKRRLIGLREFSLDEYKYSGYTFRDKEWGLHASRWGSQLQISEVGDETSIARPIWVSEDLEADSDEGVMDFDQMFQAILKGLEQFSVISSKCHKIPDAKLLSPTLLIELGFMVAVVEELPPITQPVRVVAAMTPSVFII